jgi:shikimate kinase/3-dehydroquinate synthase
MGCPRALDPGIDLDAVAAAVQRDKKRTGGVVPFVLVEAPGHVRHGVRVRDDDLRAALQELRPR